MRIYVLIMGEIGVKPSDIKYDGIRARMRSWVLLRRQFGVELSSSGRFSVFAMLQHLSTVLFGGKEN